MNQWQGKCVDAFARCQEESNREDNIRPLLEVKFDDSWSTDEEAICGNHGRLFTQTVCYKEEIGSKINSAKN